jgi:serine/threonine protein phosphatase PrpC
LRALTLSLTYAAGTDAGPVRPNNEDAFLAARQLLAVADGVGGHAAGEVASATIIEALAPLGDCDPGYDLVGRLYEAVVAGNEAIARRVAEDPRLGGMSTTLTAILFGGPRFCLLNIGDSRTYLLRDGELEQLTRDDSYVQLLVDQGHITQEAAGSHPQRNLVLPHAVLGDVLRAGAPQECVDRLIELAIDAGTRDNVTAIVADLVAG